MDNLEDIDRIYLLLSLHVPESWERRLAFEALEQDRRSLAVIPALKCPKCGSERICPECDEVDVDVRVSINGRHIYSL